MRRVKGDEGVVAVLVALLAVVLFGLGALLIDVGALYFERRQLQSGADAAALAIAQSCAEGSCGAFDDDAEVFADANALDQHARVEPGEVCGSTSVGLPTCPDTPSVSIGSGYVQVTARTEQADGSTFVPPFLARILLPDYSGQDVSARAAAAWGAAASVDAELAITFGQCEYDNLTQDEFGNPVYAQEPYTDTSLLRTIYFHDTTEASACEGQGPSGADLPGGFGWLDADSDCSATITSGWAETDPGASASSDCKAALEALLGQLVLVPVFDETNNANGNNGSYHIVSYVGFVLTGYRFPGASYPAGADAPCASNQTCIQGYFTDVVAPYAGPIGSGADTGVRVVQLVS